MTLGIMTLGIMTEVIMTLGIMTEVIMTLGIMTRGIMSLGIMTLGIMTLGIMTVGIIKLYITILGVKAKCDTQHIPMLTIQCRYAECRFSSVMLNVVVLYDNSAECRYTESRGVLHSNHE
jgi:hypothetical protein